MPKNKVQQRARAKRDTIKAQRRHQEKMRRIWTAVTVGVVAAIALTLFLVFRGGDDPATRPSATGSNAAAGTAACGGKAAGPYRGKQYQSPPKMTIDPKKTYTATFDTSCGKITARLYADRAPKTVNNFVFLARDGFYANTVFHRVIEGFMIQGGDPEGTGRGGPGYKFEDETKPTDSFDKPGLLAMANSGPNTNGSQFFITEVPTKHLDGRHTIFGEVAGGFEVVQKIVAAKKEGESPKPPVVLYSVTIAES